MSAVHGPHYFPLLSALPPVTVRLLQLVAVLDGPWAEAIDQGLFTESARPAISDGDRFLRGQGGGGRSRRGRGRCRSSAGGGGSRLGIRTARGGSSIDGGHNDLGVGGVLGGEYGVGPIFGKIGPDEGDPPG